MCEFSFLPNGDLDDPQDYGSPVRNNLMKRPGYTPYCGETSCFRRLFFTGQQFACRCGYHTDFDAEFIDAYVQRTRALEEYLAAEEEQEECPAITLPRINFRIDDYSDHALRYVDIHFQGPGRLQKEKVRAGAVEATVLKETRQQRRARDRAAAKSRKGI